jgi:hypothetical protein
MSIAALNWAFEMAITGARKSVLLALANHANDAGECWPSLERIARHAGVTDRGAQKALRELEHLALVTTRPVPGRNSRYLLALGTVPPERSSPLSGEALPNYIHPTPEQGSLPPPIVVPKPPNHVRPNLHEPSLQPTENHQTHPHARPDLLFADLQPSRKSPKPLRATDAIEAEFQEWWAEVPKKVEKVEAAKLFRQVRTKKHISAGTLIDAMRRYAAPYAPRGSDDPKFSVGPAKWLRGERWADESLPNAPATRTRPSKLDWFNDEIRDETPDPFTIEGEIA